MTFKTSMHKEQFHQHILTSNQIFITAKDVSYPMKAETRAELPRTNTMTRMRRSKMLTCPN
jgi:hypothetical protein